MKTPFTPRHLRKRHNNKSGGKDLQKQMLFRRAAQWSKAFINQSASVLESARVAPQYAAWCESSRKGNLRRTAK